jgi:hypothetical protein
MASEQGMTASYASMAPDEPPPAAGGGDGCAWKIDLQRGEGGRRVGRKREAGSMFRSGWGGGWGAAFGAQTPLSPPGSPPHKAPLLQARSAKDEEG